MKQITKDIFKLKGKELSVAITARLKESYRDARPVSYKIEPDYLKIFDGTLDSMCNT